MTDADNLRAEIAFLEAEIHGLRMRIGGGGNAVQINKLAMLERLLNRCKRGLATRENAA